MDLIAWASSNQRQPKAEIPPAKDIPLPPEPDPTPEPPPPQPSPDYTVETNPTPSGPTSPFQEPPKVEGYDPKDAEMLRDLNWMDRMMEVMDFTSPMRPAQDAEVIVVPEEPADNDSRIVKKVVEKVNDGQRPVGAVVDKNNSQYQVYLEERIVRAMAMVGGTISEIAEFLNIDNRVIVNRYGHIIRAAKAGRKLRLRQAQYQSAVDGNTTMLIWLGKQELGQFDESRAQIGDITAYSDDELLELARGRMPKRLGSGTRDTVDLPANEKE